MTDINAQLHVLGQLKDIESLMYVCSSSDELLHTCETHKKQVFMKLMEQSQFRNSFHNYFKMFVEDRDFDRLVSLLKWYPSGEMYNDSVMNKLQRVMIKFIASNIEQPPSLDVSDFYGQVFELLFLPTNKINFANIPQRFKYHTLLPLQVSEHYFDVVSFHMSHPAKFESTRRAISVIKEDIDNVRESLNGEQSTSLIGKLNESLRRFSTQDASLKQIIGGGLLGSAMKAASIVAKSPQTVLKVQGQLKQVLNNADLKDATNKLTKHLEEKTGVKVNNVLSSINTLITESKSL
jgi:hypothetical protein